MVEYFAKQRSILLNVLYDAPISKYRSPPFESKNRLFLIWTQSLKCERWKVTGWWKKWPPPTLLHSVKYISLQKLSISCKTFNKISKFHPELLHFVTLFIGSTLHHYFSTINVIGWGFLNASAPLPLTLDTLFANWAPTVLISCTASLKMIVTLMTSLVSSILALCPPTTIKTAYNSQGGAATVFSLDVF